MTERLHFEFSLSCIGKGNGTPLQCSCLGNPMDRGAWRATVHGVTRVRHDLATKQQGAEWIHAPGQSSLAQGAQPLPGHSLQREASPSPGKAPRCRAEWSPLSSDAEPLFHQLLLSQKGSLHRQGLGSLSMSVPTLPGTWWSQGG